jgi:hypothetical protein
MAYISKSGFKTVAAKATRGSILSTGMTAANTWYEVATVGTTSALPDERVGSVFRSPDTSDTQITLGTGDSAYPITLEQICKTDAEITCEEGTIDVTDDCENGFNAYILDGYRDISGTLNGFLKFDDATGELTTGAAEMLGRFFSVTTDDGEGAYVVKAAENEKFLLFMCMNKDAAVGDTQNWIILPILLSSLGTGAGLKDAQKRDLSWQKAQGPAINYRRVVFAADTIDSMFA